ncbi:MAG: glucose 1-dehydrogenase [Clostridiales bacterium]|nr:glucose 1-dehydrogenase [Clostridiales bacterium]
MKLSGKTAVVTGASSGMGKAIVELFAKEGANVVAVARREERLLELQQALASAEGKVEIYAGDISLREVNEGMIDFAIEKFGALDILVNNAGIMDDMSAIGNATDEKYEQVMAVNVYGPMAAMRKAVCVMKEQPNKGNIINVSSVGAMRTCAGAIYCASKAALLALSKNTAYMYMPDGIRCNAIAPGGINTEISTSMGMPNMEGYGRIKNVLACAPQPGEAEDIAAAALFLASDDAKYISGEVLQVDGGWLAS